MAIVFLLVFLVIFAIMGTPLAFAIGASSMSFIQSFNPNFMQMLPQRVWGGVFSFVMVAMPLFMLAGELMNTGGITKRIVAFSMYIVRPFHGGLGEVNIIASMIFGGISGSSVADTSALGSILIPSMEKEGYSSKFAAGVTVASSTMGMIIPPSVPMIVYAMASGASIGKLFIAGLVPGVLIGASQLINVNIISIKKGYHPKRTPFDMKDFIHTLLYGLPAILMPIVIVVFVSFGICTASELIIGFFFYKELTIKDVINGLAKTLRSSAAIMIIIGFTTIFTWLLTMANIPSQIAAFFLSLDLPVWGYALIFDLLILLVGAFIDVTPAILLLTPILLPVMESVGISALQFGAMLITGLAIGLVTPPVGMCLNACTKINKMQITEIFKGAFPLVVCNVIILLLISIFPSLTTYLPSLVSY